MLTSALLSAATLLVNITGIPVILDTDLGDDIDDTWALCMALGTPELDVKLIVTASDDTETKARLVGKILETIERTDIPLGIGLKNSDRPINQATWLGDYTLDKYPGTLHKDGVQAIIDTINSSKEEITLCVIGPQTNIAEALKRDADISKHARVVSMSGSVHIGYNGKVGRMPEWNVFRDVAAAKAVFAASWDITIAPLDTCGTLILKDEAFETVAKSTHPYAKVTIANYDEWSMRKKYPPNESSVLFDTLAIYLCHSDTLVKMETLKLSIDDKGNTVPDNEHGRPVHCALEWKDKQGYESHLVKTVTVGNAP